MASAVVSDEVRLTNDVDILYTTTLSSPPPPPALSNLPLNPSLKNNGASLLPVA
jgi:hypothetical protein